VWKKEESCGLEFKVCINYRWNRWKMMWAELQSLSTKVESRCEEVG